MQRYVLSSIVCSSVTNVALCLQELVAAHAQIALLTEQLQVANEKLAAVEQQLYDMQQVVPSAEPPVQPQQQQATIVEDTQSASALPSMETGDSSAEAAGNLQQLQAALEQGDAMRQLRDDLEVALEQLRFAESENTALRTQLQTALSRPPQGRSASRSNTPVSGAEKQLAELREQHERVVQELQHTQTQLNRTLEEVRMTTLQRFQVLGINRFL